MRAASRAIERDKPSSGPRPTCVPSTSRSARHEIVADAITGAAPGVRQLVRIDAHAGKIELLTQGPLGAERPKPAAHGTSLIYERALPRKYGELPHVAVCFAEP